MFANTNLIRVPIDHPVLFSVYPMDSNQPVFSVAHNALLLQLDDEHASTHNMCLSNGYALSVESEDDQQIKLVRLLSRNQLDQWDDRFMADRISPLRNPLLNETKVKIAVQNFAVNPGADTRQSLPLQPSRELPGKAQCSTEQRLSFSLSSPESGVFLSPITNPEITNFLRPYLGPKRTVSLITLSLLFAIPVGDDIRFIHT